MPRRNFRELEAKMTPKQIAERDAGVKEIIEGMPLSRVREARNLTQQHLGHMLNKNQSAISQIERRTDMYVRTLADFIKAMGGELEIRANFADGSVRITGLTDR
jgi:ribosome-binding protein aMBF1 (putative translation factor)